MSCCKGELFDTLTEVQVIIEQWRKHYNHIRPHNSLGYRPSAPEVNVSSNPHCTTLDTNQKLHQQHIK